MKFKTKKNKILFIIFMIIDIALIIFLYLRGNMVQAKTENTVTTVTEVSAVNRTITNTLTASGQIQSAITEKLTLSTSKYFKTMCIEEGDYVEEGANILQYSNGTYLTAPYNLIVTSYSVPETGSICTSSNYIEVESLDDLYMTLSVDESEIESVKVGQNADVIVNANEYKTYTGIITKINQIGTYSSSGSSFTAKISIENDGNIKIGMSASCTITLEEKEDVIAIPVQAVQTKDNMKYVILVENGETKEQAVTTGISDDSYVEIIEGLEINQIVQMTSTTTQSSGTSSNSSNYQASFMQTMSGSNQAMPGNGGNMGGRGMSQNQ